MQETPNPAAGNGHEMLFEGERRRLMGIGYRILGSVTDAEDVVQEAWLRWSSTTLSEVENPKAFLTTVVTRLSLDRLRRVQAAREVYRGPWLPEPVAVDADPEAAAELADSLSLALLVVLETLSPLERAAFVLREVFGEPYPEVAQVLGRAEPAVRQLVHRARQRLRGGGVRFHTDPANHAEVVRRFAEACQSADVDRLLAVLAPDVVLISDGGGVAPAPVRPVSGSDKVARLIIGILRKAPQGMQATMETFNGQIGIVARVNGHAVAALAFVTTEQRVQTVHLIANPVKLAVLDAGGARALQ